MSLKSFDLIKGYRKRSLQDVKSWRETGAKSPGLRRLCTVFTLMILYSLFARPLTQGFLLTKRTVKPLCYRACQKN